MRCPLHGVRSWNERCRKSCRPAHHRTRAIRYGRTRSRTASDDLLVAPEADERVLGRELFLLQLGDLQLFLLRKEDVAIDLGDLRLQLAVSAFETVDLKLHVRLASTCHGFSLCGGSGHCGQVNDRSA